MLSSLRCSGEKCICFSEEIKAVCMGLYIAFRGTCVTWSYQGLLNVDLGGSKFS